MGSALAHNAARAGLSTIAWDRNPQRAASLTGDHLRFTTDLAEAVRDADVVVTMVPDADAVTNVMQDLGAFAAMKGGATWIQMATIGLEGTGRAIQLARTRPEITFIDAPVSGSRGPAEAGKLVVLASGDQARAGAETQRFFDSIAAAVHWLGEAGAGMRMKLIFNAWLGIVMEGVAEIAILCDTLGVDPSRFGELAAAGPLFPPWALQKLHKIIEQQVEEPEFPLQWAEKDVMLALSAAGESRAELPVLEEIGTVWADAASRFGAYDLSAVYLALRQ